MVKNIIPRLDDLDFAILGELQDDSRKTYSEMAKKLGVSAGTVRNRFTRMAATGTISTIGICNPYHIGFNAPASILVTVQASYLEDAAIQISKFPEITWMAILAGEFDLQLDVACRDMDHLTDFITQRLQKVPGVVLTRTLMQLRILKYQQPSLTLARQKEPSKDKK
jgi:Lrp/AsnC family transcriptional regulator for asnA, asnC and gidA